MIRDSLTALSLLVAAFCVSAHAQSYSPLFNPSTTNGWSFACLDQNFQPIPYATYYFNTYDYVYTNSHLHTDPSQPLSLISPNNVVDYQGVGYVSTNLITTLVGEEEGIATSCYDAYGNSASGNFDYAVGYGDLDYNDHPDIWVRIGGDDTGGGSKHGSTYYNRYMQTNPATNLYWASYEYAGAHPEINQLCTNDMALPFGGKFDICNDASLNCHDRYGNLIVKPWQSPHHQHDRGTAADVAALGTAQCSNAGGSGVNISEFINDCVDNGALLRYSFNEANHAHCGFDNPANWPH